MSGEEDRILKQIKPSIEIEGILDELLNKIIIYSTSIVICMICVGILEIVYLKKFMKNRKII